MLDKFFSKLDTVHRVSTVEERDALYKQRYKLYIEELKWDLPEVDHKNKILKDSLDEDPNVIHLYTGSPENMLGSIRMITWPPGTIDAESYFVYSLNEVPHIHKLHCAEMGRLMIMPSSRGNLTFPSLMCKAMEVLVNEYNIDIILARCRPGLVPHYRKFGLRPYRVPLPNSPIGITMPLMCIPSDLEYQKAVASLVLPVFESTFASGKRACLDLEDFEPLLAEDNQLISYKAEDIWKAFQATISQPEVASGLFDQISEIDEKIILEGGLKMEVEKGAEITLEGKMEIELFFVLQGNFSVVVDNNVIARIGKGEVFGEMAFFREDSLRTATIQAAERGEVLVLSRKFIDKLRKKNPSAAFQIMFNLGRILSNRLATFTSYC